MRWFRRSGKNWTNRNPGISMIKPLILFFALLNGSWMLFDGIHVLMKGRYFGPEKPGPWSRLISRIGWNPMNMGSVFIVFGTVWIVVFFGFAADHLWAWYAGLAISTATLWYIPFGSLCSVIEIILLLII